MSYMFSYCGASYLTLSNFDTHNVTNMNDMFSGSFAYSLYLSSFNTSKVTDIVSVFWNAAATTINSFDTSNVT